MFHPFRTTLFHPVRTLAAAATGAAVAYLFDPEQGEKRRAEVTGQLRTQFERVKPASGVTETTGAESPDPEKVDPAITSDSVPAEPAISTGAAGFPDIDPTTTP